MTWDNETKTYTPEVWCPYCDAPDPYNYGQCESCGENEVTA